MEPFWRYSKVSSSTIASWAANLSRDGTAILWEFSMLLLHLERQRRGEVAECCLFVCLLDLFHLITLLLLVLL